MSTTLEKIIEEVRALSPEEQQQLRKLLEDEMPDPERTRRAALSSIIRGKYAHFGTSSDEFAARKAEEIALEDRRSAERQSRQ